LYSCVSELVFDFWIDKINFNAMILVLKLTRSEF
jgi:hypothetical protein